MSHAATALASTTVSFRNTRYKLRKSSGVGRPQVAELELYAARSATAAAVRYVLSPEDRDEAIRRLRDAPAPHVSWWIEFRNSALGDRSRDASQEAALALALLTIRQAVEEERRIVSERKAEIRRSTAEAQRIEALAEQRRIKDAQRQQAEARRLEVLAEQRRVEDAQRQRAETERQRRIQEEQRIAKLAKAKAEARAQRKSLIVVLFVYLPVGLLIVYVIIAVITSLWLSRSEIVLRSYHVSYGQSVQSRQLDVGCTNNQALAPPNLVFPFLTGWSSPMRQLVVGFISVGDLHVNHTA